MKVSKNWLQELVDLKIPVEELITLLPLRTIGTKEITEDFIELDMKGYNRADLLSMRGVAREVAAITDSPVNFSDTSEYAWTGKDLPPVKVEIQDEKLCPVYCVAKIEGLKPRKSPEDWVKKLADSGVRSIDNITDVTNLMMLEYGQTMHSFDAAKVAGETMIVRSAKPGEKFITLDGKTRDLTGEDLLIADPEKAISLSGIMGGKDSEITENTNTILLEVAIFDPISIRKSSQRFNLYSEASRRIQHGLTKTNLLQALSAAIKMYEKMGGRVTAISLTGNLKDQPKTVQLTQEKVNSRTGVDIPAEDVEKYLQSLGFSLATKDETFHGWEVTVPYWRLDIEIEEDLIEEIARMYGYERIPAKELRGELPEKVDQSFFELIYQVKSSLATAGLTQVQTYSFFSIDVLRNFQIEISQLVKVANPISSETEYLRNELWPNLVEVVAKNLKQGFEDIAIFEVGKVYHTSNGLPKEFYKLAITLMNGINSPVEELYQFYKKVVADLGLKLEESKQRGVYEEKFFHPTRSLLFKKNNKVIGGLAEVHPKFLNNFGIEKRVAILEISIDSLMK